jgi:CheY-like chemotaxis protein
MVGQTILIADDEQTVLKIAEAVLGREGFLVLTAKDGKEALAICDEYGAQIDLALLDYFMPKMNGAEVAQRLREKYPTIRIALWSGYTEYVFTKLVADSKMPSAFILQKPFFPQRLIEFVKEQLQS